MKNSILQKMIQRKKPGVDIVLDVLQACKEAYPKSEFVSSLLFQYQERGGLSKKQLEGLLGKAQKLTAIPEAKLATLEAIILKKHTKHRSAAPVKIEEPELDQSIGEMITAILARYPQHKRVLFYKLKNDKKEPFSITEKAELEKFSKLLLK